jgi:hypothetical protein
MPYEAKVTSSNLPPPFFVNMSTKKKICLIELVKLGSIYIFVLILNTSTRFQPNMQRVYLGLTIFSMT